jgi:putative ABC transport system permease protein
MIAKIPLAWLQLTKEKIRLLIAIAGIGFADILMFMQFGFKDALLQSSIIFHENLRGDIFLVSTQSTALIAMKSFSQRRLYQALAFEGVESISPVYIGLGLWKNPETRATRSIMVVGFEPEKNIFYLPGVQRNKHLIKTADIVLFDAASRPEYGPVPELFEKQKIVETEIESRRVKVKGFFELGASFGADGNVVTSDLNFLRIFENRSKGLIDIGVIQVKPGTNIEAILEEMRDKLPQDVYYFSKEEFVAWERSYWESSTPVGFVFGLGASMGFVVGIVIVYQILYTDVADHLPEYATLKAMGYRDGYFLMVVFQEAIILALIGYIPGFGISNILYVLTNKATSLPIIMTVSRAIFVLILTVFMCFVSGAIAVRKLQEADPADIF